MLLWYNFSCFLIIFLFPYSLIHLFYFVSCPILLPHFLQSFIPFVFFLNFFPTCSFSSPLIFPLYPYPSSNFSVVIFFLIFKQCPVWLAQPFSPWGWEGRGLGGEKMRKEVDLSTLLSYRKKKCYLCKVHKHSLTDSLYAILSSNLLS